MTAQTLRQIAADSRLWAKPQGHLGRLKRVLGLLDLVPLVDPLGELMSQAEGLRQQARELRQENAATTGTVSAKRITSIVNGETLPKPASDRAADVGELQAARRVVLEQARTWCLDEWENACEAVTVALRERIAAAAAGEFDPEALRTLWLRVQDRMCAAESRLLTQGAQGTGLHRQVAKCELLTAQILGRHTGPGRELAAQQGALLIAAHKAGCELGYYSKAQGQRQWARYYGLPVEIRDAQYASGTRLRPDCGVLEQPKQAKSSRPPSVWDRSNYLVGSGPGEALRGSW
ncbi:MAG: hypothetical protein U0904_11510 [Candidatus Nanopelagicales bacterium]|nr:hypothetical protein [Candidatus Nanopelagicales bacterium]